MTARTTSSILVGRDAESAALRDAFKRVRAGEPTTVLVGGEAGVGKTRLVEEFSRYAAADGAQLLTGNCLELGEEGLPFAPFAAALRDLLRRGGDAGKEAFAGQEHEFATLLPELGPPSSTASETSRAHLFDLVGGVFERLARGRPLVLILEDLHWADRSTRDLLAFLIRTARTDGTLLVVTYRTDELHRGHPLRPFLAELDRVRGVERIELDRLDRDGTGEILAQLFVAPPSASLIDNIFGRAQGNPFFVEELAACSDPDHGCNHLPDTLRDLLLSRVDQLAESAQRVLRIAAAGGSRVGHRLLAQVAELPDPELEAAMRSAVLAQLVVADADGGYEFRHALVREAVHDDLLPGEHARLHARYAAAIEVEPDLVAAGRAPVEIAHHWHAANDRPRAIAATLAAAEDSERRYAYAEQSRLLDRVLDLWEQVPGAGELIGLTHLELLERALAAAVWAGDQSRALKLTRAALSEVDSVAEPARAAWLLVRRGKLLVTFGKGDGLAELGQAYELARCVDDDWQRAALIADIARCTAVVDREAGSRLAKEAGTLAERLGDTALEISASVTYARVFGRSVPAEEGLAEMQKAYDRAIEAGEISGAAHGMVNVSDLLYELGRYEESAESARRGLTNARRVGTLRNTGVYLLANHAEALIALGQWDEADARTVKAARLDPPGALALLWMIPQVTIRLARGHAGARDLAGRALAPLTWAYLRPTDRLSLHALRIEVATGPEVEAAVTAALADPNLPDEPRYAWPMLAAAANAAGQGALGGRIRDIAATIPVRYPAEHAYSVQVKASLAEHDESRAAWEAAVVAWRADGQPYPLARALVRVAEAAAHDGDRGTVAEALAEAGAIAEVLDAGPLRDELATLARRVGVRGSSTPDTVLTGREREVLRLVAEGRSNRGIAEELYISPKTASVHVSRIIAKLNVSTRGEAAAVAHRLGLLAD